MYIYKNNAGIQLTVAELIELLDEDILNELIAVVICLDDPNAAVDMLLECDDCDCCEHEKETPDDRIQRMRNRLLGDSDGDNQDR